ncbi:hypothetical protein ABVT39_012407 [Epinephelus coioides]
MRRPHSPDTQQTTNSSDTSLPLNGGGRTPDDGGRSRSLKDATSTSAVFGLFESNTVRC